MEAPKTRAFTRTRIVALALIGLTVFGLAYLRFAPGAASVTVPTGAQAGDLHLDPCTYPTESGSYAADCGTLVVPENRTNLESRLIALPVTRIRAHAKDAGAPVFHLAGGPGGTNMVFPEASRLADSHDVVLVGYRGIDGSSVLACPEVTSVLKHSADFLGAETLRAEADAYGACADRLQHGGVDLAGYTLAQRVDDLEAARGALGYDRIDLVSESVGSRVAMIYSWRYPASIDRSVMIGVNPPGHFLWDPKTTDEQIGHYGALCAQDESCRTRTDDLAASMRQTASQMPDRWLFLPIKAGNVRFTSFFALMESTAKTAPLSGPMALSSWLSAADGDPSGLWFMSLLADLLFPNALVWGDAAASGLEDARFAEAYYAAGGDPGSILGDAGTDLVWAGGGLVDTWPANPSRDDYSRVQTSNVETLLVGGTLDFSTPAGNATSELLPSLPNGHQVVLAELGHSVDFWSYQPEASSRLVGTFLASGRVDDSLYTPAIVDFAPDTTDEALGKGLLGTMVGFALLTVLSLLWMARRAHKRGRFGRKVSATLRSVYPIVLGLGGWFLGALIVMTTMPGVPLDDELLAAFSVGLPIGLGIYFAWVDRDWSVATKATGFAAAASGALVGAWLGFHVTVGLLALITTIVGATVGANLVLLALDIAWDRQAHDRFVEANTKKTLEAGPSAV